MKGEYYTDLDPTGMRRVAARKAIAREIDSDEDGSVPVVWHRGGGGAIPGALNEQIERLGIEFIREVGWWCYPTESENRNTFTVVMTMVITLCLMRSFVILSMTFATR